MNVFEKKGAGHHIKNIFIYAILIFFTLMALYPLFWLFISSFKTTQEYQLTSKLAFLSSGGLKTILMHGFAVILLPCSLTVLFIQLFQPLQF